MKKSVNVFYKIILSSGFLAVIPAVLLLFLIPPVGSKYKLSVEKEGKDARQLDYTDLNSDSISERIYLLKGLPYYFIVASDIDNHIYDQWNLIDSVNPSLSTFFCGNYDHDLYKEIYVFTYKDDSLFLNVNEILEKGGTRMDRVFILKTGYRNGQVLSSLKPAGFYDENADAKDEVYFSITSAFNFGPRKIYSFDIENRKLNSSQFTGNIYLEPEMTDIDGDGNPEIFGNMSASCNYSINVPYTDCSTWFMVFNERLEFEFPPVEFPGFANTLSVFPYENESFKGFVLTHFVSGTDKTILKPRVMLYSAKGEKIRERIFDDIGLYDFTIMAVLKSGNTDRIVLVGEELVELNYQLEVINKARYPFNPAITYLFVKDIDFDGNDELLLYSQRDEKLAIYNAALQKISETPIQANGNILRISDYSSTERENKIFIDAGNYGYVMKLERNTYYYLGYLAYPGVYFLIFLFIIFIKRINTFQVISKESLKRRLVTLQLQGIKSQLEPHFTFNALNSVASLIYLEDRKTAYNYLVKFTHLLRNIVNDAEQVYRSLKEELEFVTAYLDLEKMRFGEKFNYTIEIGEGISQKELLPKMVLQTFAENAIKHGIMPYTDGGLLIIRINKEADYVKLTIEDNGIGRKAAAGQSKSTGKGLKITGEFFDILNQINKKPIRHLITDLYKGTGEPAGTRVEVWVPVAYPEQG